MKIAAIVSLKNGDLLSVLRERGWSGREFGALVVVSEQTLSLWLNLHSRPHEGFCLRLLSGSPVHL